MTFQARLFKHINSLWLRNLYHMGATDSKDCLAKLLYKQIKTRLSEGCTPDLWEEGYRIGHAIDGHYKATGLFELSDPSDLPFLNGEDDKAYIEYLASNMHAWAVPLSYHYLLNSSGQSLDKRLNLWGSTKSHNKYFRTLIDMTIAHLKCSESALPVGFVDVGCGDGSLLRELKAALTGVFDKEFIFIGFDLDERSCSIAAEQEQDGILFLKGDVARPEDLNISLISKGLPSLDQFFHIRAFVDHNSKPFFHEEYRRDEVNASSYYYLHNNAPIPQGFVENSFKAHFARWKPFVYRHGLGIIELHRTEACSLAQSPAIAYEIFHLLSEQYMLTYSVYAESWVNAGLTLLDIKAIPGHTSNPNVSISIYQ